MDAAARGTLRIVAGQLAAIVGVVHLGLALRAWTVPASSGDPRVRLWALFGVVVLAGLVVGTRLRRRPPLYGLGVVAMLGSVVAYFAWHLGGHVAFYHGGRPDRHGTDVLGFVVGHLATASRLEHVALATQLALAGVLLVLLAWSPRRGGESRHTRDRR